MKNRETKEGKKKKKASDTSQKPQIAKAHSVSDECLIKSVGVAGSDLCGMWTACRNKLLSTFFFSRSKCIAELTYFVFLMLLFIF